MIHGISQANKVFVLRKEGGAEPGTGFENVLNGGSLRTAVSCAFILSRMAYLVYSLASIAWL